MEKSFLEVLDGLKDYELHGNDVLVSGLEYDSRKVTKGSVFFALSGLHTDGEKYIESAIENGASAIVYENKLARFRNGICYLKVKNARKAMSHISARFYDKPSKNLQVIGVTGTEGKSSTVSFIWQMLNLLGKKAGYFSTVSYSYGSYDCEKKNPEHQTTPESTMVQRHLYEMLQNGCEYAVVEASSHGLSDRTARLADVDFDVAVFMNVSEEHLEFHKTFENYRSDKANLFRKLDENNHIKNGQRVKSFGVVNLDDSSAEYFSHETKKNIYGFTTNYDKNGFAKCLSYVLSAKNTSENTAGLDFQFSEIKSFEDVSLQIKEYMANTKLAGSFNVKNILASLITVSKSTGTEISKILSILPKIKSISGRMFYVNEGQSFSVLIDYAHTPTSFEVIMPSQAKKAHSNGKKLIAVFGSGGERDTKKRPEQGRVASKYCDIIILTDEDPRKEGSMPILNMIAEGVKGKKINETLFLISDRKKAIRKAFSLSCPGDIVLLLGKGHENTIIFDDDVMPYDEESEARQALKELLK